MAKETGIIDSSGNSIYMDDDGDLFVYLDGEPDYSATATTEYWMAMADDAHKNDPEDRWHFYEENVPEWMFETPTAKTFQRCRQDNDPKQWIDSHLAEI